MMEIEKTVHGAKNELGQQLDQAVFAEIGHWLLDAEIHKRLGMAATARDGDIWFIARDELFGRPLGFAQLRPTKGGKAGHIRYLFIADGADTAALRRLAKHVADYADGYGMRNVHTNDRRDSDVWPALGFKPKDNKRGGSFIRWEWSEAQEGAK